MGESEPFYEQTKKSSENILSIFFEGVIPLSPTWFCSHCSKNGNGAAMRAAIALSGSQFNKTRDESIRRTCSAFLTFLVLDSSDDERRKRFFLCSSILWCVYFCCIKISEIYYYSSLYFFCAIYGDDWLMIISFPGIYLYPCVSKSLWKSYNHIYYLPI